MARMDQAAATFKGLTADIHKVSHTDVVNVNDADDGTIVVKKYKPGDTRIRIDLTNPKQNVAIGGGKAIVFKPLTNEATGGGTRQKPRHRGSVHATRIRQ